MKYRLKKDLPFAKAGEEIFYDVEMGTVRVAGSHHSCTIPLYLRSEWVEEIEVKPREWWLVINKDNGVLGTFKYPDHARNHYESLRNKEGYNIIKVREVLE